MKNTASRLAVIAIICLSSCATTQMSTARYREVKGTVVHMPVTADLDVRPERVTATVTARSSNTLQSVKTMAINEALKASKADLLIEPSYETSTTAGKHTVTVTGYPAFYKNFRTLTEAEVPAMEAGRLYVSEAKRTEELPQKKKGAGAIIAGILALGALVVLFGI
jgi:cobalamin biosynthesis Mg chelatase CobN